LGLGKRFPKTNHRPDECQVAPGCAITVVLLLPQTAEITAISLQSPNIGGNSFPDRAGFFQPVERPCFDGCIASARGMWVIESLRRIVMWQFWIDVGGTFTDCFAVDPAGTQHVLKVLSSGLTKGTVEQAADRMLRTTLRSPVVDFYRGYRLLWLDDRGAACGETTVEASAPEGTIVVASANIASASEAGAGSRFELTSGDEAPLLAIRTGLGLRLDQSIPPVQVRLGTTRGTNALLTRRGAKTGLVTTRGFADVLRIANQDRPRLFDLDIQKPEPLFVAVAEVDERLASDGTVLDPARRTQIAEALMSLRLAGCQSLAICLLHGYLNPVHEALVADVAAEQGWTDVSVSHRLSPLIKLVPRAETTVLDAYLNPVLRDYVGALQRKLPGSDLRLMTSAGGLVTADKFTGKESVLSGPAGGVVGFSRVSQVAGYERAIGFDMGGTSTDVSRFDGRCDLEYETVKAGVRVVTPMLAIETVAAGGGSLCGFDGVKLFVGPQSAGSDPGPACYGRGGPLTVTDCNVYLGRIPEQGFPFVLDRQAIERRLQALCDELAAAGSTYTPHSLAAGFLEIANAAMARAIRSVSVAKGYDPADYVLVPFGGAGGQHACALARELGMRRVLAHPLAGVLSAYGIGHADIKRYRQRAVLKPWSPDVLRELQSWVDELAAGARDEVLEQGVPADRIAPPRVQWDLRYQGTDTVIGVAVDEVGSSHADVAAGYTRRHQQLYGYVRPGRAMEVVAVRVEVTGQNAAALVRSPPATRRSTPTWTTAVQNAWFDGRSQPCPLITRPELQPGMQICGPAIVGEGTSTLVIDPGYAATVLADGALLIEPVGIDTAAEVGETSQPDSAATAIAVAQAQTAPAGPDPVQLELFHHTFGSIAEQMGLTLQQTSLSTNVKERLDFSCALFDPHGGLVVNAPHIPVHLGAMGETVRCILRDNPDLQPGDVFITNDPYRGGSHLPDVTVVTPVHDPLTKQLVCLTASRAHHAEIGGIAPGSMPPFSKNLAEEGVLIRNVRLIAAGESREAELERLLGSGAYPSRSVADNLADVRAQVAANQRGVQLFLDLVARRGRQTVLDYMQHLQAAASRAMRRALSSLPPGTVRFEDHLDDGSPIAATVTVHGEAATIDFTGTGPVLKTNLNANRAIVTAAVMYVLRCLIGRDATAALDKQLPLNGGVLEPITLVLPECLLNPSEGPTAAQCPAMVGGNVETSQRVVDVLLGAFGLAAASQGTMNNLTFGDGTFGYYETICGGAGATARAPGADAVHTHMTNTRLTDPEVLERRYPVRLQEFSIRRGSGGTGQHRGGDGIVRRIECLRALTVSLLTERRGKYAPYGLAGGQPGTIGQNTLQIAQTGEHRDLGGKATFQMQPGDVLTIASPGGGGYGHTT
jgi:5-oxoprolinase (ATP-hydrolysing)